MTNTDWVRGGVFVAISETLSGFEYAPTQKSSKHSLTICVPEIFADLKSYRKANIIRN